MTGRKVAPRLGLRAIAGKGRLGCWIWGDWGGSVCRRGKATSTVSGLEVHRALIASWLEQNVPGTAILAALRREHGYTGSYSSVYRMIVSINADRPPEATVPLSFAPGEAAEVDFGAGNKIRLLCPRPLCGHSSSPGH